MFKDNRSQLVIKRRVAVRQLQRRRRRLEDHRNERQAQPRKSVAQQNVMLPATRRRQH